MPHSQYRFGRKGGKPDFFLATPSFSGRPCSNYTIALCDSAAYLASQGVCFDYWLHAEDCHVDDSRNYLVSEFMKSGAPYLIFIDDDVGWDAESLAKLYLYKDADIVGGVYPLKQHNEDYPVRIIKKDMQFARPDGLLEVEGLPTGFMRISREVIEKMIEKRKHMIFTPKSGGPDNYVIFERRICDSKRWSGDLNFCREARQLGFKVWCDPEMGFSHQGYHRWEGKLGNFLRRKSGILDQKLDEAIQQLMKGDTSQENFEKMFKSYYEHHSMFCVGPSLLKMFYHACEEATGPILECGSGLTSIVGGIACQRNGQYVHAIEHDLEWWKQTRHLIQLWAVRPIHLHYCPLKEYEGEEPFDWYDYEYGDSKDRLPEKFNVLLLDGPPRRYGREGLFKCFLERIKDAHVWLVDDMEMDEAAALVNKYAEACGRPQLEILGNKGDPKARHVGVSIRK